MHEAKIIPHEDGYSYWYAVLPFQEEAYALESLDSKGKVLANEMLK